MCGESNTRKKKDIFLNIETSCILGFVPNKLGRQTELKGCVHTTFHLFIIILDLRMNLPGCNALSLWMCGQRITAKCITQRTVHYTKWQLSKALRKQSVKGLHSQWLFKGAGEGRGRCIIHTGIIAGNRSGLVLNWSQCFPAGRIALHVPPC